MSTALINATSENTLTPAMATVLYVVSDHVDSLRLKAVPVEGLWIRMPSARLRGTGGRNDNIWLRKCLERLQTIRMGGEYRGDPWGAVMISQFRITEGGTVCEILLPPAAVEVLCAPETFAKIEAHAAYKLQGASRRLYVALADKKRMAQDHWTFPLDELRGVLGANNKKSYQRWNNFKHWVLEPAVEAINDFGTVKIRMTYGAVDFSFKGDLVCRKWPAPCGTGHHSKFAISQVTLDCALILAKNLSTPSASS